MIQYVVGIAFSEDHRTVLLLRKNRPKWQAGRLNGVGGKVEPGEDFPTAMAREFQEETGLTVPVEMWRHIVTYHGPDYEIRFFTTTTNMVFDAQAVTDEVPRLVDVAVIPTAPVIGNIRWIVPMCLDPHIEVPVVVREPTPAMQSHREF